MNSIIRPCCFTLLICAAAVESQHGDDIASLRSLAKAPGAHSWVISARVEAASLLADLGTKKKKVVFNYQIPEFEVGGLWYERHFYGVRTLSGLFIWIPL